ncbi:FkbM family methyltransferase [Nitratireductor mangrovi]|uniref:FkbM family methyltransferase n=1 Tax=Nitratireductor mangrovi TaxID=2599600 RepID=A0A5B8KXV1_9HYPH|nr:FkbM family methyltransferase [Nitratireductor mangrovi]QDZ00356.2 FkbM family methyltransferase [Nitratireductor mangrovi]
MTLPVQDRIRFYIPGAIYYRHKVWADIRKGEPELAVLSDLVPPGSALAVDVGCNRGVYSYALSRLCEKVIAFEPNGDLIAFSRRKLPPNVELRQLALGRENASGKLRIPISPSGNERHLSASLWDAEDAGPSRIQEVDVRRLDDLGLGRLNFIKIDVEGTEMDVLAGAAETIARERPTLLIEILAGYYSQPIEKIEAICSQYGYEARLLANDGSWQDAVDYLHAGGSFSTRNVVFQPRKTN